jgi:TonB family protein
MYTSNENAELIGDFDDRLDFDVPPMLVRAARPEYPDIAQKMGAEGMVRLKALILEDGTIGGVQVEESANPILVDAAITALRESLFIPAKKAGQPCCGTVIIPFIFGSEEKWVSDLKGVDVDYTGAVEDIGFAPVEPPERSGRYLRPAK